MRQKGKLRIVSFFVLLPPATKLGKVMFLQVCVILFTGGEYLTRYPPGPGTPPRTRYPPRNQVHPPGPGTPPPGPGTPPDQVPPQTRYTPQARQRQTPCLGRPSPPRWPLQRTVRILLECILVHWRIQGGVPGDAPPPGVQILSFSCSFRQKCEK